MLLALLNDVFKFGQGSVSKQILSYLTFKASTKEVEIKFNFFYISLFIWQLFINWLVYVNWQFDYEWY